MQLSSKTSNKTYWPKNHLITNRRNNPSVSTPAIINPQNGYLGNPSDKICKDIIYIILDQCSVFDIFQMKQVSRFYEKLCNEERMWELYCRIVQPDIQKTNEISWKQTYINLEFNRFRGGMQVVQFYPSCDVMELDVDTTKEGLKGKHLKKLIKHQTEDSYSLEEICIFYNCKEILEDQLIKPLNINNSQVLDIQLTEDEIMSLSGRDIALNPQK